MIEHTPEAAPLPDFSKEDEPRLIVDSALLFGAAIVRRVAPGAVMMAHERDFSGRRLVTRQGTEGQPHFFDRLSEELYRRGAPLNYRDKVSPEDVDPNGIVSFCYADLESPWQLETAGFAVLPIPFSSHVDRGYLHVYAESDVVDRDTVPRAQYLSSGPLERGDLVVVNNDIVDDPVFGTVHPALVSVDRPDTLLHLEVYAHMRSPFPVGAS